MKYIKPYPLNESKFKELVKAVSIDPSQLKTIKNPNPKVWMMETRLRQVFPTIIFDDGNGSRVDITAFSDHFVIGLNNNHIFDSPPTGKKIKDFDVAVKYLYQVLAERTLDMPKITKLSQKPTQNINAFRDCVLSSANWKRDTNRNINKYYLKGDARIDICITPGMKIAVYKKEYVIHLTASNKMGCEVIKKADIQKIDNIKYHNDGSGGGWFASNSLKQIVDVFYSVANQIESSLMK